jgi:hypothetical protein
VSEDLLEWTVHLARRHPGKTVFAVLVVAAGSLAAGFGFRSLAAGMLAGILLIGSISDYLFPVRYRLGPVRIEARGPLFRRRLGWGEVRRVFRDPAGVKLSPLARRSRLEAYRGIYVWFEGNESVVMAAISRHTDSEATDGGSDQLV